MADEKPSSATGPVQIGSYKLVEQLGSGGMSSVFRALHVETGHEVALKVLPRTLAKNPTLLQRFLREAKSAESLQHPNIVAIYDRGMEDGRYYLVLEYVPGGDLHDRVRDKGPLSVAEAVKVTRGVVEALRYAAGEGLIHRDIKPANILLGPDGEAKVADLGLALHTEDDDEQITRDGTTVGTVDYMSPEQARDSRATSIRSDMYSLGCSLYQTLTGTAPFAGGDVTEKLRRHAFEPAPDVRKLRPDVPEALARLIQKLLAKKPDNRFRDYPDLLAALARVPIPADGSAPLFALIDEDEPLPVPADLALPPGSTTTVTPPAPLYALIDEDDEDDSLPVLDTPAPTERPKPPETRPRPKSDPAPASKRRTPPPDSLTASSVNLSELAALEEPVPSRPASRRPAPAARSPSAAGDALIPLAGKPAAPLRRGPDGSLRDWIVRGVLAGLVIVLVGFGLQQLVAVVSGPDTPPPQGAENRRFQEDPRRRVRRERSRAGGCHDLQGRRAQVGGARGCAPAAPEPERPYPGNLETVVTPDWAAEEPAVSGPTVVVRRGEAPASGRASSLAGAFETAGGITEIADTGPFFEHDLKLGNSSRLVRAQPGLRALVVLEAPQNEANRDSARLLELAGKNLVLENLDLVVPLADYPKGQDTLFLIRSGTLLLRDCTLTIIGASKRPFRVARFESASGNGADRRRPRVRCERTLVRGPAVTLVQMAEGPGDVLLSRSVVLSGAAPAFQSLRTKEPLPPESRTFALLRSVLAGSGSIWDLAPGEDRPTVHIGAVGSQFLRVAGGARSSALIVTPVTPAKGPKSVVDWFGDENLVAGWFALLSTGVTAAPLVPHLAAAREVWPTIGAHSRERAAVGPAAIGQGGSTPQELLTDLPEARAILQRVASPSPFLREKTLAALEPLVLPAPPPLPPAVDLMLTFDTGAAPWNGDLGAFLAEKKPLPGWRVRVVVRGQGSHALSPITGWPGCALEIRVEPPAANTPPVEWTPGPRALDAAALFHIQNGDLSLQGVRLRQTGPSGPRHWIEVEEGRLAMQYCQIVAPGVAEPDHALIVFRAATTRPLAPGPHLPPNAPGHDLPVAELVDCALITGGDAIEADLARGVVALSNCAVAALDAALVLKPQPVSHARFQADLRLDHCTLAAQKAFLQLGAWTGNAAGPDRPWLVATRNTAFLDIFDRGKNSPQRAVLLLSDEQGLRRGALLWQSRDDGYEVARFLAFGSAPSTTPAPRADIERDWVTFWGRAHVSRYDGPGHVLALKPKTKPPSLKPSDIQPADLYVPTTGGTSLGAHPPAPPAASAATPGKGAAPAAKKARPAASLKTNRAF